MKIIGKTLEGDLIIRVSQAEWDGLQDGIRPKDDVARYWGWPDTEAGKLLTSFSKVRRIRQAYKDGKIDGSIESLWDIANGKIFVRSIGAGTCAALKTLLDERT